MRRLTVLCCAAALTLPASVTLAPGHAAASSPPPAPVLYAAPGGSGSSCSISRPCSLSGAQQAVIRYRSRDAAHSVTVQLADGTYRLRSPLRFGPADSGSPGHPVIWQAAPGAHPVISGGIHVTGWTESDPAHNTWSAAVPAGSQSQQLYVNGQPAPVASESVSSLGLDLASFGASGFTTAGSTSSYFSHLAAQIGPADVSAVRFVWSPMPPTDWEASECPVSSIGPGTISMAQPCWDDLTNKAPTEWGGNDSNITPYSLDPGSPPTTIENAYPLLQPGQWYLDQPTHTLYYMAQPGQDPTTMDFELPQTQSLLDVTGTLANPATNMTFQGMTFTTATWDQPASNAGYDQVQGGLTMTGASNQGECTFVAPGSPAGSCPWAGFTNPLANVQLTAADHITFTGDTFTDLGGVGLGLRYGSDDNLVQGNTFTDIAYSALWLGCSGDPDPANHRADPPSAVKSLCSAGNAAGDSIGANEVMTGNTVEDNVIYHDAIGYLGSAGVTLLFTQHTTVSHNDIFGMPYDGVTSGAWQGHPDTGLGTWNTTTNINGFNKISGNLYHTNMQATGDGGDLYSEGHQGVTVYSGGKIDTKASYAHGTVVSGNVSDTNSPFTDYAYAPDAGSQWITVTGNVEWNCHYSMSSHWPSAQHPYTRNYQNFYADPDDTNPNGGSWDNTAIPAAPGPADVPLTVVSHAGVQGSYQSLEAAVPRSVWYSGVDPASGATPAEALIGATGLTTSTTVFFNGVASPHVQYLSSSFLVAQVPPGVPDNATVTLG